MCWNSPKLIFITRWFNAFLLIKTKKVGQMKWPPSKIDSNHFVPASNHVQRIRKSWKEPSSKIEINGLNPIDNASNHARARTLSPAEGAAKMRGGRREGGKQALRFNCAPFE